jgi:putative FmdB family regulatory protein
MPIYEFKCADCGTEFERVVFSSDEVVLECPECNSKEVQKVLSVFAMGGEKSPFAGATGSSSSSCGHGSGGFS